MSIFSSLFGRKKRRRRRSSSRSENWTRQPQGPRTGSASAGPDIWDLDAVDSMPDPERDDTAFAPEEEAEIAPSTVRGRRMQTRLIGFETGDGELTETFSDAAPISGTEATLRYPVGWLVIVRGPGRGFGFGLSTGMAQIGRGDDQAVRLDFGDTAISRYNHAAIVFDPSTRGFLLGHGGKANIVRLNGRPVVSNEEMVDGDEITIGETTLRLRAFCGPDFSWDDEADQDADDEERDDVGLL